MPINKQKWLIWSSLILTLAATGYFYLNDHSTDIGIEVIDRHTANQSSSISTSENKARNPEIHPARFIQDSTQDIFEPKVEIVEPVKEVVQALPPPKPIIITPVIAPVPMAPPIPFTYIGKYSEDGKLAVFLGYKGKNLIVKAGDIIQQTYKIEEIKPPLLTIVYMPMGIKQSIQIGEAQ